jgi:phenylacetate-CoA ligase
LAASVSSRLCGTAVTAWHAFRQRRVPYLPPDKLNQLRDRRLRWMVRYAADTVPHFRDLFREQGMDPGDIRSVDDLRRLPLLDRRTVCLQPERFRSRSRWGDKALPFHTTGSTGAPFTAYHDRHSLLLASAASQRERDVLTRGFGLSPTYRSLAITYPESASNRVAAALSEMRFLPVGPRRTRLSVLQPIEEVITAINHHRPEVLEGYGSYLEALFRMVTVRQTNMHRPQLIVYYSDGMTDSGKHLIESEWGIPVISRYMAVEAFRIGFMCEERRGFHLHTDLTHLEIVNADGERLPAGQAGEVVVSNLINRGTVLLNYRLGDVGVLSAERCPCGRTLPLLSQLLGRTHDVIYLRDGGFVHPTEIVRIFQAAMLENRRVLQYQLVQHDWERFELKLATDDRPTFDRLARHYVSELRQVLGPEATIEAVYYAERLPPGPGGKFRDVVSLLQHR